MASKESKAAGTREVAPVRPAPRKRLTLDDMTHLGTGKRTRLHRLLYKYGPANGTLLVLPYDQGLEHGPRDFMPQPLAADPEYVIRLAKEGRFSAFACEIGIAEKYMREFAGEVPLILKLNGKSEIPGVAPFSPMNGTVADAVRLGADAVGYTIYVGSPAQSEDFLQFSRVREEAEQAGLPVIVWSYPRGEYVDAKGGQHAFWAVDYAARIALELGADLVKLHMPRYEADNSSLYPKPYDNADEVPTDPAGMLEHVVRSAGKTMVIVSGGLKDTEEQVLEYARMAFQAGVTGLIFGRNVWQRPYDEALAITERFQLVAKEFGR